MTIVLVSFCTVSAQTHVNTLAELRTAVQQSNQTIVLEPGNYNINVLPANSRYFPCSGSNNIIHLTGVYINFPVGSSKEAHFQFSGDNNKLIGGEFENTYASGLIEVSDFVAYNNDRNNLAYGCDPHLIFTGSGNTVVGTKMTVRGSFPYGYGSYFGIGGSSVFGLSKRGGIAVQGPNTTIDSCELQMQAFGHGIYLQSAADNTVIKNTLVEGVVRPTNDILAEGNGSLPYKNDYKDNDGNAIEPNEMESLCEDGIRTYPGGGSVTVENCTVKKMRGGIRLYLEPDANVTNTIAIDCGNVNWNMPSSGKVSNSSGNFAYAPLSDFRLSRSNIEAEWTIIPSPHAVGAHNLADVLGNNHKLVFHRTPGPLDPNTRPIVVTGDNSTIVNETEYPIILESTASGNNITSCGPVIDYGSGNTIQRNNCAPFGAKDTIEAEDYTNMSGIETSSTTDEGLGDKISAIDAGDWLEYDVEIAEAGMYWMDYRVSGADGGFMLVVNGEPAETLNFNATADSETWQTVRSNSAVYLAEGPNTLRLNAQLAGWDLNWIQLLPGCYDTEIVTYISTVSVFGIESEAEPISETTIFPGTTVQINALPEFGGNWLWNGPAGFTSTDRVLTLSDMQKSQGGDYYVSFTNSCGQISRDTLHINIQDSLRIEAEAYSAMSGISVEACTDIIADSMVSSISSGDWMEYVINVPVPALYNIDYRVAGESDNNEFELSLNDEVREQVSFNQTGGSQVWTTVQSGNTIYLPAGIQTCRIISKSEGFNMNWLQLNAVELVKECALPYEEAAFRIFNTTLDWTSGVMDISCESEVDLFVSVRCIGSLGDTDYLNIYYKLDGGEQVALLETTEAIPDQMVSATKLSGQTLEIIVQGQIGTSVLCDVKGIYVLKSKDPFARIEAEDYDEANGTKTETCSDAGGGLNVGSINDGHWLKFSNLNMSEVHSVNLRLASRNSGGTIELRLDSESGKLIGTVDMPNTGNWQTWKTISTNLENVVGFYDLFLVFSHPTTYVGNINWLELSPNIIGDPSAIEDIGIGSNEIILYPNPVEDFLNILNNAGSELRVINLTGKTVLQSKITSDQHLESFHHIESGIYVVQLIKDNKVLRLKIAHR